MPMVFVGARLRARANGLGTNDKAAAAAVTASRDRALTWALPFSALEAVATETPAARATSASVTVPVGRIVLLVSSLIMPPKPVYESS